MLLKKIRRIANMLEKTKHAEKKQWDGKKE